MDHVSESALEALPNDDFWEQSEEVKKEIQYLAVQLALLKKPFVDSALNKKFAGTYAGNAFKQIRFALFFQALLTTNRLFENARTDTKNHDDSNKKKKHLLGLLRIIVIRDFYKKNSENISAIEKKIRSFRETEPFKKLRVFRSENLAHRILSSTDREKFPNESTYVPPDICEAIETMQEGLKIADELWQALAGCSLRLDNISRFWQSYADEFWLPIEERFQEPNAESTP